MINSKSIKKTITVFFATFISLISFSQLTQDGVFWRLTATNPSNGYIRFGPTNSSFAHFDTDRSRFYFSKPLYLANGILSSYLHSSIKLQTNGSTRLEILSNGNAQFAKSVYINSDKTLNFGNNTPSSGKMRFLSSNSSYNNFIDFKGNLYFRNIDNSTGSGNEGACLSLQSDGSISIGTWEKYDNSTIDLQGNKLSVNGGILCERLKVISSVPESDYVFEKEYNLLSLSEVESFIKKYKHLPEVPSAKEFKENGYDLGEMDDLLLRKVEELTLYVIELQKEIETLKKSK